MSELAIKESILLVDDEENIRSSLRRLFRADNYRVLTAASGEEGLAVLDSQAISLVIADNGMPGMNGSEFLRRVRGRWPDTIRVMLTGYADLEAAMAAINRGEVYRFVTKPWEPAELRALVRDGLAQYRLVKENRRLHALVEQLDALLEDWHESLQRPTAERPAASERQSAALERLCAQLKGGFVNDDNGVD
ncbi:MAG: response regulator [Chloroflexota bacterium]